MKELQYELIEKSGRGGSREGAGRPKGEDTKRIRVPVGCMDEVLRVIEAYKAGQESKSDNAPSPVRNSGQQSKSDNAPSPVRNSGQQSKSDIEKPMIQTKHGYIDARYWWTDADGSNVYWSGRGRRPAWFSNYLSNGGSKSDLDISTWTAGTKWKKPKTAN